MKWVWLFFTSFALGFAIAQGCRSAFPPAAVGGPVAKADAPALDDAASKAACDKEPGCIWIGTLEPGESRAVTYEITFKDKRQEGKKK